MVARQRHIQLPFAISGVWLYWFTLLLAVWFLFLAGIFVRTPTAKLKQVELLFAPATVQELRWGLLSSNLAGLIEEIVYRCVLFGILLQSRIFG